MRKSSILSFGLLLGALGLAGCAKDDVSQDTPKVKNPVDVIVTADNGTRTAYSGEGDSHTTKWIASDKLGVFAYSVSNPEWDPFGANVSFSSINRDGSYAEFSGQLDRGTYIAEDEDHQIVYYAYYPYQTSAQTGKGSILVNLPAEQHPTSASYDSAADFLMGGKVEADAKLGYVKKEGAYKPVNFVFSRPVAFVKFNFTDIPASVEGEVVKKVTLTVADASLAGNVQVDLAAGTFAIQDGASDKVTLVYDGSEVLDTDFCAWFVINPTSTATFNIRIETSNHYIDKAVTAGSTLDFAANAVNRAAIGLAAPAAVVTEKVFVTFYEVRAQLADFSGDYLIVYQDQAMSNAWKSTANQYATFVNIAGHKEAATGFYVFDDGKPAYTYTFAKEPVGSAHEGKYTLYNQTLKYIQASDADNYYIRGVASVTANGYWSLTRNNDGSFDVTSPKANATNPALYHKLQWNDASNGKSFGAYTEQKKVSLFRELKAGETIQLGTPTLSASSTASSYKITWAAVADADGYQVSTDGGDTWGALQTTTEFEKTTGVTPATEYTVWVKAIGSGIYGDSAYAEVTVETRAAGAVEITLTILPDDFGTSYPATLATKNASASDGSSVSYAYFGVRLNSSVINLQANNATTLYNTTEMGKIKSIKLTGYSSGKPNAPTVYEGNSAGTTTTLLNPSVGTDYTYTLSGENGYFTIKHASGTNYALVTCASIIITYEVSE